MNSKSNEQNSKRTHITNVIDIGMIKALVISYEPTECTRTYDGQVTHVIGRKEDGFFVGTYLGNDGTYGQGTYAIGTFREAMRIALSAGCRDEDCEIVMYDSPLFGVLNILPKYRTCNKVSEGKCTNGFQCAAFSGSCVFGEVSE